MQSQCGKVLTRITANTDLLYAVKVSVTDFEHVLACWVKRIDCLLGSVSVVIACQSFFLFGNN